MKMLTAATIGIVASLALVGQAKAACPAGVTKPQQLLDGTNWAFIVDDVVDGSIGTFQANALRTSWASGTLNGSWTSNSNGNVQYHAALNGNYTVTSDCLGGTFFFNIHNVSYQFAFLVVSQNELYLITAGGLEVPNRTLGPFLGNNGRAVRLAGAAQCPTGSPLSLLVGNWSYLAEDLVSGAIGRFTASIPGPNPYNGLLSAYQITSGFGLMRLGENISGTYTVDPDCSGGVLKFPYNSDEFEYQFVFAGPGQIFMVSVSTEFFSSTLGEFFGRHGTAVQQH